MKPKKGPIALLVPPVLHGNWKKEWSKLTEAQGIKALKIELKSKLEIPHVKRRD